MTRWTAERKDELRTLWAQGLPRAEIMRRMSLTKGQLAGKSRVLNLPYRSGGVVPLRADHPALDEARTIFPSRVVPAERGLNVLRPGSDSRKLGNRVTKGAWAGMPIYSLTLEERATCPLSCHNWRTCYGNAMQLAIRHEAGPELERVLDRELADLAARHPGGFVVRLHILGDFYSTGYVERWAGWLRRLPALRVFGYTAFAPESRIGAAVARVNAAHPDRFAIRQSSRAPGPGRVITVARAEDAEALADVIACPAESGKTRSCATCGLCWAPGAAGKTIAFVLHGMKGPGKGRRKVAA